MKRIITLTLLCTTLLIQSHAQMEVVNFQLLENDVTAQMHGTEKDDQNGDRCAIIKIVTPESDFSFDPGSLGIVARENHTGEIWLYVPRKSKKLTIKHQYYGVTREYFYPEEIKGGRTYEMLIDLGTGRYVNISSEIAGSTIYIDGKDCGTDPIKPRYLSYGPHKVSANKDRYEGEVSFVITANDEKRIRPVNIPQFDMSDHYGDVTVTVDNKADIFFEDRNVGTGSWRTQLREGNYTVETRKADCDPVKTTFTVVAQRQNDIKVNAPTPHTGRLSIYTRPGNVKTTYNGNHFIDLSETVSVPIGTYQMEFSRKGYVTQNHEYIVKHNETVTDTVTLDQINYIKPTGFYFGLAFTASTLSGISGIAGATYKNHDVQLSYTFGLVESAVANWMTSEGHRDASNTYKLNSFAIKYGYQIPLLNKMALTPQLGYALNTLSSTVTYGNTKYADGAKADLLSIGAKVTYVPFHHCYLFVAPEVDIVIKKDDTYNAAASKAGFTQGGFVLHAGVLVNF